MATKKSESIFDKPIIRTILTVISAVLSTGVLALSTLTIINVYNHSYGVAPKFLVWIFMLFGLISLVSYMQHRTKVNLIRCLVLLAFDVLLGVVVLFAKDNPYLFSLTAGLYSVTLIISRVFILIQKHTVRDIVLNALIIVLMVVISIGLFTPVEGEERIQSVILLECVFIAVVSFIEAASLAFSQLKIRVLVKVIVNTYSLEVLFGLLTMIVCFSLVFFTNEPEMPTFADALWYCFAVVTTIGFGDIVAVTPIGRILTVILGFYGLIVVAVITSIIVTFYNETAGKHDQKEIKEIKNQEEKDKR